MSCVDQWDATPFEPYLPVSQALLARGSRSRHRRGGERVREGLDPGPTKESGAFAVAIAAALISRATRFFQIGLRGDNSCNAALAVKILEPAEAVPAVAHDLAGFELFGQLEQAGLGPNDFLVLGHDNLS